MSKNNNNNISLPWLQAIRNNKILMIIAISEAVCIVLLVLAIIIMMPLKEKIPVYVEFSSSGNNFVKIAKANEDITSNEILKSYLLCKYVIDRETVDRITEQKRYQNIAASSSSKLYEQFKSVYGDEKTGLYYKEGFKRAVMIIRDYSLAFGVHRVEIQTTDTDQYSNVKISKWIINIKYKFADQENIKYDDRFFNPLGLLVTEYTITAEPTEPKALPNN